MGFFPHMKGRENPNVIWALCTLVAEGFHGDAWMKPLQDDRSHQ
jgi:hypothetical protein